MSLYLMKLYILACSAIKLHNLKSLVVLSNMLLHELVCSLRHHYIYIYIYILPAKITCSATRNLEEHRLWIIAILFCLWLSGPSDSKCSSRDFDYM